MSNPAINIASIDSLADAMAAEVKEGETIINMPVGDLKRGQFQPREEIDQNGLKAFSESIKSQGVLLPLLIRKLPDASHEIVAGERRWRAAIMAGLEVVPCVVRDIDDDAALAAALVENIDRENMKVIEEALGVANLVERTSSKVAAEILGKKAQWVSKRVKIARAPSYVITFVKAGYSTDVEGLYQLSRLAEKDDQQARNLVDLWTKDPTSRASLRQHVLRALEAHKPKKRDDKVEDIPAGSDDEPVSEGQDLNKDEQGASKPKKQKTPPPPVTINSASAEGVLLVCDTNEGVIKFELGDGAKKSILEALKAL